MVATNNVDRRDDLLLTAIEEWQGAEEFIADRVLPPFPVAKSTGEVPRVLQRRRIESIRRPKYGTFGQAPLLVDSAGIFNAQEIGFEEPLDDKDIEILGGLEQAESIAALKAVQTVLLAREDAIAQTMQNVAVFDNTPVSTIWTDKDNALPIDDVATAKQEVLLQTGQDANAVIVSAEALTNLQKSQQIQDAVRAILGASGQAMGISFDIPANVLAQVFNVDQVIIGRAVKNTADDGQAEASEFVWAKDRVVVAHLTDPANLVDVGVGRTFVWERGLTSKGDKVELPQSMMGMRAESYVYDRTDTEYVRVRRYEDELITNARAAHILTGAG